MLVVVGIVKNIDSFKSGICSPNLDIFVSLIAFLISLFLTIRGINSMLNDRKNVSVFLIYLFGLLLLILMCYR
jgi:hypothetical protein